MIIASAEHVRSQALRFEISPFAQLTVKAFSVKRPRLGSR